MPTLAAILVPLLLIPAAWWLVVMVRLRRLAADPPTVRRGLDVSLETYPSVSIVIPAHNEERVIDACVRGLRAQEYDDLEIIFVLDRCTDGTLDIVRAHAADDPRIVVIENDDCPDGWAGKCNAARLGAERARGDWLLFTDADTEFDPQLCRAAVALAVDRGLGLLSLLSSLTYDRRFERIAQPVASIMLIQMYPIERINGVTKVRPFANGQFLLFDRAWYERLGGHTAVREYLLEDIAFARALFEAGGRGEVALADRMLTCSMYDSLDAFKRGWTRIFIEACKRKPARLRRQGLRILLLGVGAPLLYVVALGVVAMLFAGGAVTMPTILLGAALFAIVTQAVALPWLYRVGDTPGSAAVFFPLGAWIVARIMFTGARDLERRRPVSWGGREYVIEPR